MLKGINPHSYERLQTAAGGREAITICFCFVFQRNFQSSTSKFKIPYVSYPLWKSNSLSGFLYLEYVIILSCVYVEVLRLSTWRAALVLLCIVNVSATCHYHHVGIATSTQRQWQLVARRFYTSRSLPSASVWLRLTRLWSSEQARFSTRQRSRLYICGTWMGLNYGGRMVQNPSTTSTVMTWLRRSRVDLIQDVRKCVQLKIGTEIIDLVSQESQTAQTRLTWIWLGLVFCGICDRNRVWGQDNTTLVLLTNNSASSCGKWCT